jgi:hypothetical protein
VDGDNHGKMIILFIIIIIFNFYLFATSW